MKWYLSISLFALFALPLWPQNNYAVDFNSSQSDLLRAAVANFRASDQVGFISLWLILDSPAQFNTIWGSSDEATTVRYVGGRYYHNYLGNYTTTILQTNNDALSAIGQDRQLSGSTVYHLVMGVNGSQALVWINGVKTTNNAIAGSDAGDWFADTQLRDNFTLGAIRATSTLLPMDGKIDETSVHNVTPTQAIVDAIYNNGTPRDVTSVSGAGVVNYWRFEEGTGQYAFDSVGSDTLVFGDDATVEADDPAWVASEFGWDAGVSDTTINKFTVAFNMDEGTQDLYFYDHGSTVTGSPLGSGLTTIDSSSGSGTATNLDNLTADVSTFRQGDTSRFIAEFVIVARE